MTTLVPAIDLGGTRLRVSLVDVAARRAEAVRHVSTPDDPSAFADAVSAMLQALGAAKGPLGVAAAPELDTEGVVRRWPNRPSYVGAPLLAPLRVLGFAPTVLGDGAAAALAVHPGDGSTTLFLGLGTGVAGGAVVAGSLLRGAGGAAMDVGHMPVPTAAGRPCACGRSGCLQAVASAVAVADRCRAEGLAPEDLAGAYSVGDPAAAWVTNELLAAVAEAMAILATAFDPHRIVLDAGFLGGGPFVEAVAMRLARTHPRTVVARPAFPGEAPLIGAAVAAAVHAR